MLIAKNEGFLENDLDNTTKDILLSAAYYHDIGLHSKNSARKIKKMDLVYANGQEYSERDRKILQAVVEAHDGKDKNIAKICKKYKIDEQDIEYTMQLITVLKDADALDRVRLDVNLPISMQTNLNPRDLRRNTSKQLLNASYQLESLTKKVSFDRILAYKTCVQQEGGIIEDKREKFIEGLRQGITEMPQTLQSIKKTLTLKKEHYKSKLTGNRITNKIRNFKNQENKQYCGYDR